MVCDEKTKVKVVTQGGEGKEIEYTEGMTVFVALTEAGADLKKEATVTVNGRDVAMDFPLKAEDMLVVTPKIANG